jgi:hypothetical protein
MTKTLFAAVVFFGLPAAGLALLAVAVARNPWPELPLAILGGAVGMIVVYVLSQPRYRQKQLPSYYGIGGIILIVFLTSLLSTSSSAVVIIIAIVEGFALPLLYGVFIKKRNYGSRNSST